MSNLRFMKRTLTLSLILFVILGTIRAQNKNESRMDEMWGEATVKSSSVSSEKVKFFDESNFSMFIHWGLFSQLGGIWENKTYYGIGEWIKNPRMAGIPDDEYMAVAKDFNPSEFDAMAIAQLAKDAGMKYIIITSKHHEGFAMFHSKVSKFNIVDATPFGRDPMKELSEACEKLGLGFGFYYSHYQDWTTPGAHGGPKTFPDGSPAEFKDYFYSKCKPQVREICTNYGDLDFVWFDTPGNMPKEYVVELANLVRELQPNAMMCSRVGYGMGDYASNGDMEVPNVNTPGLWETCDTNNDSWSYAWYDNNFKSPKITLERLISTVARGGSYLFNVGPDAKGNIPEVGVKFLRETGEWIKKYPQAIYAAGASPWGHRLPWGDVTTQGNKLNLIVYDWPQDGKLYLPGLDSKIKSAYMLVDGKKKKLKFTKDASWTVFDVPYKPLDPIISVIEVALDVEAKSARVNQNYGVYPNIENECLVEISNPVNIDIKEKRWMEKFGEWKGVHQVSDWKDNSKVQWTIEVKDPGYYYLDLNYKGEDRLVWKTTTDEGVMVQNQQAATEKYVYYHMGILEFKTAGEHSVEVTLVEGDPKTSSLNALKLTPIQ